MATQAQGSNPKLSQVRIDATTGEVIQADRRVHVTTGDTVHFLAVGGNPTGLTVSFHYRAGSPFAPGHGPTNPQLINLPNPPIPVTAAADPCGKTYKYDVLKNGAVTDDPDVIIE